MNCPLQRQHCACSQSSLLRFGAALLFTHCSQSMMAVCKSSATCLLPGAFMGHGDAARMGQLWRLRAGHASPTPRRAVNASSTPRQEQLRHQKEEQRLAAQRRREEVAQARQRRKQQTTQFRKRTRTGQPVMKYRIGMLLEQLQAGKA